MDARGRNVKCGRWCYVLLVLLVVGAGLLLWTGRARAAADPDELDELPDSGPTGEPDADQTTEEAGG